MMKKYIMALLALISLVSANIKAGQNPGAGNIPKSERQLRRGLYQVYEKNPFFYKMSKCSYFEDTDYWLFTLKAHVKSLEKKIAEQRSLMQSASFKRALLLFPSIGWAGLARYVDSRDRSDKGFCIFLGYAYGSIFMTIPVVIGAYGAYKCTNYALCGNYIEKQIERLQRDKRLIVIFEMEKKKQAEKVSA
jgi:hypothetical protein